MHRDSEYLSYIRRLPCCLCSRRPPSDPHHIETGGMGMKCSDYLTVPLCREDHEKVQQAKRTWRERMQREALRCLSNYTAGQRIQLEARNPEPVHIPTGNGDAF